MTSRDLVIRRRHRRRNAFDYHASVMRRAAASVIALFIVAGVVAALMLVGVSLLFATQSYHRIAETVVPAEELIGEMSRGGARVYDRNGVFLYEFVDEYAGLRRPVPLDRISEWVQLATIATEDADFYENRGINVRGMARAGMENFTPFLVGNGEFFEGSGGSSITQQLAKNVYIPREQRAARSLDRKLQETVIAIELTERYSKEQLLEWYLNSISYGGIYTGIEAAAQGYFGKSAAELNLAEAALLAGIPQSPERFYPLSATNFDSAKRQLAPAGHAKARQAQVLNLMVHHGMITQPEADEALRAPLTFRERRFEIEAPHFVLGRVATEIRARFGERALYEDGLVITTTLDLGLQQLAEEALEQHLVEHGEPHGMHNGAFVALNPRTAELLVWVGSRDYFRGDILGRNDNVVARNSPGSTLKPFGYMAAFMRGWGTGTLIEDGPLVIVDDVGNRFEPTNPGNSGFQGQIRTDHALGNSLNIPAIRAIQFVGVQDTIEMLERVGYTTLDNPGGYGPALITGGSEVSLLDQVVAYSVLATGGVMRGQESIVEGNLASSLRQLEPVALLRVEDSDRRVLYEYDGPVEERVVAEEYTYLVTHILSSPGNTCIVYSSCHALALPNGYPSAAKTGTSEPYENQRAVGDTWTIGYTPELVAGIWSGNSDNAPISRNMNSTLVALNSWKAFMVAAMDYLDLPPSEFPRPGGVAEHRVGRTPSLYAEAVAHLYDRRRAVSEREVAAREEAANEEASAAATSHPASAPEGTGATAGSGPAQALIASPAHGSVVSGQMALTGTAAGANMTGYRLLIGAGEHPSEWYPFHQSSTPVQGGSLGTWDMSSLPGGLYTIVLVVSQAGGPDVSHAVRITVNN